VGEGGDDLGLHLLCLTRFEARVKLHQLALVGCVVVVLQLCGKAKSRTHGETSSAERVPAICKRVGFRRRSKRPRDERSWKMRTGKD